jgi:hypothetical protein
MNEMVQIGNYHIGRTNTAKEPIINSGEVFFLWHFLLFRYGCIEKTRLYVQLIHDTEFKLVVQKELHNTLEKQAKEMEELMNNFKLPLPHRPPANENIEANSKTINDRFIFSDIFLGCITLIGYLAHGIGHFTTNDSLRKKFIGFLTTELEVYDDMCKYGKVKGWLQEPPLA